MNEERDFKGELKALLEDVAKSGWEAAIPSLIAECLKDGKFENISNWDLLDCTAYQCHKYKKKIK